MANLSKSREAALKALVSVDKDGAYLNLSLRDILLQAGMDQRDNALSTLLAFGVIKNKLYIDNIISNLSKVKIKKLSVWILNILRIGIYSIKFLDRVPVSATVNECVKLSRRYGHSASAGLVNAVLRKASQSGDFLPEDTQSNEYLSLKYSFPLWLVELWNSQGYGEALLQAMNETPSVIVRLNTLKKDCLDAQFEKLSSAPHAYIYKGASVEQTDEYVNGIISVQDTASQIAVSLFSPKENSRVLDLCAAPGGKTAYAAQLMNNTGEIISCDIHPHKLELIKSNLSRLGITNTVVLQNDATVLNEEFIDAFDSVICDVPCSGLGIIRRRPDIKWTKTEDDLSSLTDISGKILENGAKYVKCGGKLLFSTCTINKAENEDAAKFFLESHPNFKLIFTKQLLPHIDNSDGFFIAIFERIK